MLSLRTERDETWMTAWTTFFWLHYIGRNLIRHNLWPQMMSPAQDGNCCERNTGHSTMEIKCSHLVYLFKSTHTQLYLFFWHGFRIVTIQCQTLLEKWRRIKLLWILPNCLWDETCSFFSAKFEKFRKVGVFSWELLGDICELVGINWNLHKKAG